MPGLASEGKMRAFRGNSFDDYYDHGMKDYPLPARFFFGIVVIVVYVVTKILWPWTIEDESYIEPAEKGRVLIQNHVSMLEPIPMICACWLKGIRIRPIFKSEFNANLLLTWFFSRVGGIPVKRGTADMKALRRAKAALSRGEYILIYPEGTRIRTDTEPVEIHGGFALMAQMADALILPSAVVGARDITQEGRVFKRIFWRVYFRMGEPLEVKARENESKKQCISRVEKQAMDVVYRLRDELRLEHPTKH